MKKKKSRNRPTPPHVKSTPQVFGETIIIDKHRKVFVSRQPNNGNPGWFIKLINNAHKKQKEKLIPISEEGLQAVLKLIFQTLEVEEIRSMITHLQFLHKSKKEPQNKPPQIQENGNENK